MTFGAFIESFWILIQDLTPSNTQTPPWKYSRTTMTMAHKKITRHVGNASDELDQSVLSRGQLVQMVIDLRRCLDEHRAKADRERELVAIHYNTTECKEGVVLQVNHQMLT